MNDSFRIWTLLSIGVYMAHDIVTDNFLPLPCDIIVNVLCMCL